MAAMFSIVVSFGACVWIAAPHTARTGSHAADSERTRIGQLLHDLRSSDLQLGWVDLPAVTRRHIAESLGVELSRQRRHAEPLHCVCDDLSASIVHSQRSFIVLIDEDLKRLQQAEDRLFANLAATSNAVFLRTHIQQGVVNQIFSPDQDAGRLRPADVLATAESDHIETDRRILQSRETGGTSAEASLKV